jgi:hypothetical protein
MGAGVPPLCADLEASIHFRRVPVMACWLSRAEADVKVKVCVSWADIRMEAFGAVTGVCWRSRGSSISIVLHYGRGPL